MNSGLNNILLIIINILWVLAVAGWYYKRGYKAGREAVLKERK